MVRQRLMEMYVCLSLTDFSLHLCLHHFLGIYILRLVKQVKLALYFGPR